MVHNNLCYHEEPGDSMYSSFEENINRKMLSGRVLRVLEFDRIIAQLTDNARTPFGQKLCRELLPCGDFDWVSSQIKQTDDAYGYIQEYGVLPLSGVSDIRSSIAYAESGGVLSMQDLLYVAAFLRVVDKLTRHVQNHPSTNNDFIDQVSLLFGNNELEKEISFCIISEEEMSDRASQELYSIRQKIRQAQTKIRETLDKIIKNAPHALQEQLITLRNDRYVVPVRAEKKGDIKGIVHDTSSSGQTVFVEPMAVVEINNKICEWSAAEQEEMYRIRQQLSLETSNQADLIRANIDIIAQIDLCSAKAMLASQMRASMPIINNEGRIKLKKARHPLIDEQSVVPIDFEVGHQFRTLVVTGPNTGGKTVSLKTCGLLTLMSMAGLFIPCLDHSEVAVFEKVLADIGDEQSIEQSLSTFSAHMTNIVEIIEKADASTLVLVDELGSGTDPSEGAALAMAILNEFRNKGAVTVATTHYKELKGYAVETQGVENACCEFDTDTLSPTYRLLIGLPGVSNAFVISKKLGLSDSVIESAQALLTQEGIRFEELLSAAEKKNRESERLKKEILEIRKHAQKERKDLIQERKQLERNKAQILNQAREEKRELIESAFEEIDALMKTIREKKQEENLDEQERQLRIIRRNLRADMDQLDADEAMIEKQIEPGDKPQKHKIGTLYFSNVLGIEGVLTSMPDSKGMCMIKSGDISMSVPADSLRKSNQSLQNSNHSKNHFSSNNRSVRQSSGVSNIKKKKTAEASTEIMLIGKTVAEAIPELDHFIDGCVLSGMHRIRIVHGKGSGKLRQAVSNYLRNDARILNYRIGELSEGAEGVTIAQIK